MSQSPNSTDKTDILKIYRVSNIKTRCRKTDHGFDGISDKFARNIYGTTKGHVTPYVIVLSLTATRYFCQNVALKIHQRKTLRVVRCWLRSRTNVDRVLPKRDFMWTQLMYPENQLNMLSNKPLKDNIEINYRVGQLQDVSTNYDIIINHAVLEWLSEPFVAIDLLIETVTAKWLSIPKLF